MNKNQILMAEIEKRLEELEKEIASHYGKIDTLETIYNELSKVVIFAENIEEGSRLRKLEFDSMVNRGEAVCECCGEKVVKESDGYYYCGVCDYEHYLGEDIDEDDCTPDLFRDELSHCDSCDDCDCDNCEFNDDDYDNEDEYDEEFCIICDSKMEYGVDNDGGEYYDCPNCERREYM